MAGVVSIHLLLMKFRRLIAQSRANLEQDPAIHGTLSLNVFDSGAHWMFEKLNENGNSKLRFNSRTNYSAYGILKYSVSLLAFVVSAYLLMKISWLLIPLSVVIFYIAEVHFLFLFPVLLDNAERPLLTSMRETYRTGIFTAVFTVIPIGFFMLLGLLNFRDPLRNWYVGCLAVIIWYRDEVRNRIQPSV